MADSILNYNKLFLYDKWPGAADPRFGTPPDGFTGASHHGVATAFYPVGTKIQVYNLTTGLAGYSTFIYLKLEAQGAHHTASTLAMHMVVLHSDAVPYDVTNDAANELGTTMGPIAIALSHFADDYYGWFWCGGVCPADFVPTLVTAGAQAGHVFTVNNVAIGDMCWCDLAPTAVLDSGDLGFCLPAADTTTRVGFAMAADE